MPALLLSLILFQAAPLLGPKPPAPPPVDPSIHVIANPDWLSKPTAEQVADLYPQAAADNGVEGRALMICNVSAQGLLVGCAVDSESPPGAGFGQAVLGMAPHFRMAPTTRDGAPVAGGTIRIPVLFRLPKPSDEEPPGSTPSVIRPTWVKTPGAADLARAYPRRAKGASGDVRLRCVIAANGRFDTCDVIAETPGGLGFGAAALELSKRFQMAAVDQEGGKVAGRAIRVPIRFTPPRQD